MELDSTAAASRTFAGFAHPRLFSRVSLLARARCVGVNAMDIFGSRSGDIWLAWTMSPDRLVISPLRFMPLLLGVVSHIVIGR